MRSEYADLCVMNADETVLKTASRFGWSKVCVASEFKDVKSFTAFAESVRAIKADGIRAYAGAVITGNVPENAKKAVEQADLVIVDARDEESCRQASESYEVDVILSPEKYVAADMIDSRGSGLDQVMAKFMAERGIAYGIRFSDILNSYGSKRIQLYGRIRQNIMLAGKYGVNVIAATGASNPYELRAPLEIAALLSFLGLNENAVKTVSENPLQVLQKSEARSSPDIITGGLKVADWGRQNKNPKRKHGWY